MQKRTLQISQVEVVAELLLQSCARHTPLDGYACVGRWAVTHQPSTEQIVGWSDLYSIKGSFSSQQINNCGGGSPALTAVL